MTENEMKVIVHPKHYARIKAFRAIDYEIFRFSNCELVWVNPLGFHSWSWILSWTFDSPEAVMRMRSVRILGFDFTYWTHSSEMFK